MDLPFVSIIIVNWNGKEFLKDCLTSIRKINYEKSKYEVILVDNGSTDGSVEFVEKNFPWVKIVKLKKNYGFAKGNNIGAKVAKGEYLVFLNNDTMVTKDWLINLVRPMEKNEKIGSCTSKILFYTEKNKINAVGGKKSIFGINYSIGENEDKNKFKKPFPVFFPQGCSMIIRKDVFKKIGKFDEDFFCLEEDSDLGWRLWNNKYKVMAEPSSIVYHRASATYKKMKVYESWIFYLYPRNSLMSMFKNARMRDLVWMLPLFFSTIGFELIFFSLVGKREIVKAIIKGVKDFFKKYWKKTMKKRKKIPKTGYANKFIAGFESISEIIPRTKKYL